MNTRIRKVVSLGALLAAAFVLPTGILSAQEEEEEYDEYAIVAVDDPLERFNRSIFKFNGTVTKFVLAPVAKGYTTVVPRPARRGIGNFFENLAFPVRFAGCLLQGRLDRSAAEVGKVLLNSTVGIGGLFKVSDKVPELQVPSEDLGQAFGAWGIGHGPYLVLPVLGPSSVRELAGRVAAYPLDPLDPLAWKFVKKMDWRVRSGLDVLKTVEGLPDTLDNLDRVTRSAVDPYVAVRNGYIQFRDAAVKR